jgi:hypothetical protein
LSISRFKIPAFLCDLCTTICLFRIFYIFCSFNSLAFLRFFVHICGPEFPALDPTLRLRASALLSVNFNHLRENFSAPLFATWPLSAGKPHGQPIAMPTSHQKPAIVQNAPAPSPPRFSGGD